MAQWMCREGTWNQNLPSTWRDKWINKFLEAMEERRSPKVQCNVCAEECIRVFQKYRAEQYVWRSPGPNSAAHKFRGSCVWMIRIWELITIDQYKKPGTEAIEANLNYWQECPATKFLRWRHQCRWRRCILIQPTMQYNTSLICIVIWPPSEQPTINVMQFCI
jgi:hypothetical protein